MRAVIYIPDPTDPESGAICASYTASEEAVASYAERRGMRSLPFTPTADLPDEAFASLDATHRVVAGALVKIAA